MQFEQIASAQFQIGTGSETITIEGVPYIWDSTRSGRDEQASLAVATYVWDAWVRQEIAELKGQADE
jgi:hypothetical protein